MMFAPYKNPNNKGWPIYWNITYYVDIDIDRIKTPCRQPVRGYLTI